MAADDLRYFGKTPDEALRFAVRKVDAAETWEELQPDWREIKHTVTTETKLFQLRKKTRRKPSAGNIQRQETLRHLCSRIQRLRLNYQLSLGDDPMASQEMKRFVADWKAVSDLASELNELKRFVADWEAS